MPLSRKHYQSLAAIFKAHSRRALNDAGNNGGADIWLSIRDDITDYLANDNPNFDRDRFRRATEPDGKGEPDAPSGAIHRLPPQTTLENVVIPFNLKSEYRTMKIRNIGSNQTEVQLGNGDAVLVSYQTPVAAHINGVAYETETRYSVTTSKHISQWLGLSRKEREKVGQTVERPQAFFDNLLEIPRETI